MALTIPRQHAANTGDDSSHERKRRVLKHGATALVKAIAGAIVLKNEDLFFLTAPDGRVPLGNHHGLGLYYHDCRYLNGYEMTMGGVYPDVLASTAERGYMASFELTNPDLHSPGRHMIRKEQISIRWIRALDQETLALYDEIDFQNLSMDAVSFDVSLTFQSAFEDIFQVRGAEPDHRGTLEPPAWRDGALHLRYAGADQVLRQLTISADPHPAQTSASTGTFHIALQPRATQSVKLSLALTESQGKPAAGSRAHVARDLKRIDDKLEQRVHQWLAHTTNIQCDSLLVNQVLDRSWRDLEMLASHIQGHDFYAAGVPWFATLFGRDSVITALETLAVNPTIAEQTCRVLAA